MTSTTDFDNSEITQQYSHINTRFDLSDEELDNDNSSARLFERSRIKALAGESMNGKQAAASLRRSGDGFLRWQCCFKSVWRANRMSYNGCLFILGGFEWVQCLWPSLRFSQTMKSHRGRSIILLRRSQLEPRRCYARFSWCHQPPPTPAAGPWHRSTPQLTGIACTFPECSASHRSGQLSCPSACHSTLASLAFLAKLVSRDPPAGSAARGFKIAVAPWLTEV